MELSVLSDAISTISSSNSVVFSKFFVNRHHGFSSANVLSISDDQQSPPCSAAGFVSISPKDSVAPPPVKPNRIKRRKTRKVRRILIGGGDDEDDRVDFGYLFDGGYYGSFGGVGGGGGGDGGGGGGGGGSWNFGGFGWEDSSSNSISDPAFDFVYEVLSWIVLSNCLHFAFKKVVRIVCDPAREKVPMRLAPVC